MSLHLRNRAHRLGAYVEAKALPVHVSAYAAHVDTRRRSSRHTSGVLGVELDVDALHVDGWS
jgi:hypothetical protein